MPLADWQTRRAQAHFLGNNQQISDYAAACDFVRRLRVVLPWATKGNSLPLPSLRAAFKQPVQREPGPIWQWKDRMPVEKRAFYGSLPRKCRVLLAPDVLPAFYRASGRTGDAEDYLIDYDEGKLAHVGKQVMDVLSQENCCIQDLRRRLQQRGVDCRRLSSELDDLREKFYVTHVGLVEEGHGYGFIWGWVDRQWPEAVEQGMRLSKAVARGRVLTALLHAAVLAQRKELQRMTGWNQAHFDSALQSLLDDGTVQPLPEGDWLCLAAAAGCC